MPRVRFVNEDIDLEVPEGTTLMEAATQVGIFVRRSWVDCGGKGLPGCNCKVFVRGPEDHVSKKTLLEKLPLRAMHGELRLACQTKVTGNISVATLG